MKKSIKWNNDKYIKRGKIKKENEIFKKYL